MWIKAGFRLGYDCPRQTPLLFALRVHPSRRGDILEQENLSFDPPLAARDYLDPFGNLCTRIVAPGGPFTVATEFLIRDSGQPDDIAPEAKQHDVGDLPDDVLLYLFGSRYCDTDRLADTAYRLFGDTRPGWERVQAICDYVHDHLAFDYQQADSQRSAWNGYHDRVGVCRDFAHLAVTFCRCMNIPARYCTGYLGDFGVPADPAPMDFSAWFEVWLGGRWYTFDARHNTPRIGRILMATGRDATDVALSTSFGLAKLTQFEVVSEEVAEPDLPVVSFPHRSWTGRRRRPCPPRRPAARGRAAPG